MRLVMANGAVLPMPAAGGPDGAMRAGLAAAGVGAGGDLGAGLALLEDFFRAEVGMREEAMG
jgi:hypothetical protein